MMKKILLPILMISLLFLVSCSNDSAPVSSGGAYIGGTQGVVAEFEPFGVENEIYDTESFTIDVNLRNKGEYEIQPNDISVELKGPSLDFSGIPALKLTNPEVIDPISEFLSEGGEEIINFASDAKYIPSVVGEIAREWFANVEYNYETHLIIPEVCLKGDLTDDRVCDVKESKTYFVSGAPITIKSVTEDTAGKGIMAITITLSNVGTGDVTKQGEEFSTYDTLSYSIDDLDWECKSGGRVNEARLSNGQAEIVCKLKDALDESIISTKQLKLVFNYKYRDLIQQKLTIKESS